MISAVLTPLALGHRIDHDGRAVREEVDLCDLTPAFGEHVEHPALELRRRRVDLAGADLLAEPLSGSVEK